jgi:peptide/nickel transport system permease protein
MTPATVAGAGPGPAAAAAARAAGAVPARTMSPARRNLRAFLRHRGGVIGAVLVLLFAAMALTADVIAPYDPLAQDLRARLKPPSAEHWLGTDDFGRDVLSRVLHGSRVSLRLGLVAVAVALLVGGMVGLLAGYYGGLFDLLGMRIMDLMLAFPSILLSIVVVAILGPSLTNAMIAVGIMAVPQYARIVRGSVLSVRGLEYVQASRALGAADPRILARAILPNVAGPIIVTASLGLATAILDAAGLSFLGLGAQPPTPEWGSMLSQGRELVLVAPWVLTAPGVAVFLAVLGFNLVGDALRDLLDPRRG